MRKYLVLIIVCIYSLFSNAQNVGVGVPNPQNKLHVGGGFRLDTLTGVGGAGLLWHNVNGVVYGLKYTGNQNEVLRGDGTFGPYNPAINGALGWLLTGNSGTNPTNNFLGTTDNVPLNIRANNLRSGLIDQQSGNTGWGYKTLLNTSGILSSNSFAVRNTAFGSEALSNLEAGQDNTALGYNALNKNIGGSINAVAFGWRNTAVGSAALFSNTFGMSNTATGFNSLRENVNGDDNNAYGNSALQFNQANYNNAFGSYALNLNQNGASNSAFGSFALHQNTTGYENTAVGNYSLQRNNGYYNTGLGVKSLYFNTGGHDNTALGYSALYNNSTASFNTSVGAFSLYQNETGHSNTSIGYFSMLQNTVGSFNTAMGTGALNGNEYGKNNTAVGYNSLLKNGGIFAEYNTAIGSYALENNFYGYNNTAIGSSALQNNVSGRQNTAVGYAAGYHLPNSVTNVTVIGYGAGFAGTESNHVNIGNDLVTWNGGRLPWSTWSDKRMKEDIEENVPGLAFITRLKPVTYHINISKQRAVTKAKDLDEKDWEGKYDIEKIKMTGFLAQDVEAAAAEINYDFSGVHKPKSSEGLYSLQYAAFVVPLVKAVQEQQSMIEKQQKQIDDLLKRLEALEKK